MLANSNANVRRRASYHMSGYEVSALFEKALGNAQNGMVEVWSPRYSRGAGLISRINAVVGL